MVLKKFDTEFGQVRAESQGEVDLWVESQKAGKEVVVDKKEEARLKRAEEKREQDREDKAEDKKESKK